MTGVILYPVAETAEAALNAPRGYAEREREARTAAACDVAFTTEPTGPAFADRQAAEAAYRLALGETPWARLQPLTPEAGAAEGTLVQAGGEGAAGGPAKARAGRAKRPGSVPPSRPVYREGRRWPEPLAPSPEPAGWRLWVSYWRIAKTGGAATGVAARTLRRTAASRDLGAAAAAGGALHALARQPLRPVRPQQPLDFGLFEAARPEAPDLIIPDD